MSSLSALEAERSRTLARVAALTADVASIDRSTGFTSADDEHDPEGTTLSLERSRAIALLADAEAYVAEISEAAQRIADGRYGICEVCGAAIPAARLEARPAARTCVGCAG